MKKLEDKVRDVIKESPVKGETYAQLVKANALPDLNEAIYRLGVRDFIDELYEYSQDIENETKQERVEDFISDFEGKLFVLVQKELKAHYNDKVIWPEGAEPYESEKFDVLGSVVEKVINANRANIEAQVKKKAGIK